MYWIYDRGNWVNLLENSDYQDHFWPDDVNFEEAYLKHLGFNPDKNTISNWPGVSEETIKLNDRGWRGTRIAYYRPGKDANFSVASKYHGIFSMDIIYDDMKYIFIKDFPSFISFTKEISHFMPRLITVDLLKDVKEENKEYFQ